MIEAQKLYSISSASKALDVSKPQLYKLMKAGLIRYVHIGSDRRIPAEEIDRISKEGIQTKAA